MGLVASLEDDIAELEKLNSTTTKEGESEDGKNNQETGDRGNTARSRLSARRNTRDTGASPQDKGGVSQEDDAASRETRGDTRGSSGGTREDARTPQGVGGTPQGSEGDRAGDRVLNDQDQADQEPTTAKGWVEHRQKLREAEVKARALEKEIAELRKGGSATPATEKKPIEALTPIEEPKIRDIKDLGTEPDKTRDLAAWLLWDSERKQLLIDNWQAKQEKAERQQKLNDSVREAVRYTDGVLENYKKVNPDFDNAYKHARQAYKDAIKRVYSNVSDQTIESRIKHEELQLAIKCEKEGTNLGDVLYDMAISRFGYDPDNAPSPAQRQADSNVRQSVRPNLRRIADNKRRTASGLDGGGQSGRSTVTLSAAADMSMEELQNLRKEDWEYLRSQGF